MDIQQRINLAILEALHNSGQPSHYRPAPSNSDGTKASPSSPMKSAVDSRTARNTEAHRLGRRRSGWRSRHRLECCVDAAP